MLHSERSGGIIKSKNIKYKSDKPNSTSILDRDISDLAYKIESIVKRYIGLILTFPAVIFLLLLCQPFNYPAKSDLVFEECTFIRYDYEKSENAKGSVTKYYNVYVEEYATPLEIDNIVYDDIDTRVLHKLKAGDIITVSIKEFKGAYSLYALYLGDECVLSYDEYLSVHKNNSDGTIKILIVLLVITSGWLLAEIIYFKEKGEAISWRYIRFLNI